MNIAEELRAQANQHPLDADLEMFNVAANRIKALESALIQMADANSNWAMNMDDKTVDAIHHLIVQAQTADYSESDIDDYCQPVFTAIGLDEIKLPTIGA